MKYLFLIIYNVAELSYTDNTFSNLFILFVIDLDDNKNKRSYFNWNINRCKYKCPLYKTFHAICICIVTSGFNSTGERASIDGPGELFWSSHLTWCTLRLRPIGSNESQFWRRMNMWVFKLLVFSLLFQLPLNCSKPSSYIITFKVYKACLLDDPFGLAFYQEFIRFDSWDHTLNHCVQKY